MKVYINGKLANWYDLEELKSNLNKKTIEVTNININNNLIEIQYIGR